MKEYVVSTGRTEEEAIGNTLQELGLERDDVTVEVLNRAKTGFLGFGYVPAKVKIGYDVPDSTPEPTPEPMPEPTPKPAPKPEPTPKPAPKAKGVNKKAPLTAEEVEAVTMGIRQYLSGLLPLLQVTATPVIYFEDDHFIVNLQGENLGSLIGRRGETLDAIQQLTTYSVSKICPKGIRIYMDAENYRQKREETLRKLARKVAGEAVKHHRNVPLEPMNAYERHIIHLALEDIPNVSTFSTGNDPNRRTVVAYAPKKRRPPQTPQD